MSESPAKATGSVPVPATVGRGDWLFLAVMGALAGGYALIIVAMLVADLAFVDLADFGPLLASPDIRYSIVLSLFSCLVTALLSVLVALPTGYLLARYQFRGKVLLDALLDIPIVLPPLVIGLSLLMLLHSPPGRWLEGLLEQHFDTRFTYAVPGVILAQFMVACAFAIRTLRATFDQINPRAEGVALTLGASRWQAFSLVVLPRAWRGVLTAGTIAWARALGEFGPILVFAGATRRRTEVLSTTVFLELSVGNVAGAVAVSLLMVGVAVLVLVLIRIWGQSEGPGGRP